MRTSRKLLILGGTSEAAALARRLAGDPAWQVTTSLAGRTSAPAAVPGRQRVGGFGGAEGLARALRGEDYAALVDATHPFAAVMPWNAHAACAVTGTPQLRLERAAWHPGPGDRWTTVPSLAAASAALAGARRVFLTTGRQELAPFAGHDGVWFLLRAIEPPAALPFPAEVVLARGPFTVDDEEALMRRHAIDTLVTKNSGAEATAAKLEAARRLGVRVVMVERPPKPTAATVATVAEACAWLAALPVLAAAR